ncbi:YbjQ family protein [Salicibibacter cibarius]|uniref:UPF0145 protein HUG15_11690 n=1 Tax=Salicibibacter cibarius TaxID=2743000 RepID=A0A7T6Z362_9BACI|nr:YbjQ family protein [Salicibibacter cibarius]QQK76153.1 YbjQ family protein [Salicibibacter cibarius]
MLIATTDQLENHHVQEVIGYVKGNAIKTKHLGNDIMASLKALVGGEIREYDDMLNQARQMAISRMVQEAEEKGANAIIGFRMQNSAIMKSASEIVAYGTGVKIEFPPNG